MKIWHITWECEIKTLPIDKETQDYYLFFWYRANGIIWLAEWGDYRLPVAVAMAGADQPAKETKS